MTEKTISHYNIRRELGRGGMGIVYEAEDTKLHRSVALKVLSPHLLSSEDDRARFYREARSAAALNHPNIAIVHAVDESVDESGAHHPFIAMEFIDGQSLRQIIDDGPLKLDDAIRICGDAAAALHAAHSKDIVHRDVKAANIMLTGDGTVKVLDFGLAKTAQSTMLTKTGSTLGTAAYMSPEQATTMDVDHRSDIWSLGVVLYEMVAGKLPFGAAYEQAVVYSILNEDPEPLTAVRTGVPMELERVVMKCLMKDPKLRYQHADELVADLAAIQSGHTGMRTTTSMKLAPVREKRTISFGVIAAAVLAGLVLGAGATWMYSQNDGMALVGHGVAGPTHRLTLKLPESAPLDPVGEAFLGVGQPALDISSDGRLLVYVAATDRGTQLYLRELDSPETRALEGTEGAVGPFFSPDASWIAYTASGILMKVPVEGGKPIEIGVIAEGLGGDWSTDGFIWSTVGQGRALAKISSDGGAVQEIDVESVASHRYTPRAKAGELPSLLPGNQHVLVSKTNGIVVTPTAGGAEMPVHSQGSNAKYSPSGHIIFALPGRLMAAPFDLQERVMSGSPVPVADNVRTEVVRRAAQYAFSNTGTLVYAAGGAADLARLVVVDLDGNSEPLPFEPDYFGLFALSPDGTKLAINTVGPTQELWIYDLARSRKTRVGETAYCPLTWTPDSQRLLHCEMEAEKLIVVARPVDGGESVRIFETTLGESTYSVSSDSKYFLTATLSEIRQYEVEGSGPKDPVWSIPIDGWGPYFSPDGRYVSVTSFETGESQVFVISLDGSGRRWQISGDGGEEALWSQDGKWLFYSLGTRWYRTPVSTEPEFTFGQPQVAFEGPYLNVPGFGYAVYPDAEHFIVVESVTEGGTIRELQVVENWFGELERLAPTK